MTKRPPSADRTGRQLAKFYDRIPKINCRGWCHDQCTAIDASQLERDRLAARGFPLPRENGIRQLHRAIAAEELPRCPALGEDNRCSAYDDRPLICRAWGVTEEMPCYYGCEPEGDPMTVEDFQTLARGIERVSRAATGVARAPLPEDTRGRRR